MQVHASKIYHRWSLENHRPGALGFILRDYLQGHDITLQGYTECVDSIRSTYPELVQDYTDWYLPSIVENLTDWEYSADLIHSAISKSTAPYLWQYLFPYVLSLLPPFNVETTLKWVPLIQHWPANLQRHFYNHVDQGSTLVLISDELNNTQLKQINVLRLEVCLASPYVAANITVWDSVWQALSTLDWQGFEDHYRNVSWLWLQHASLSNIATYVGNASAILCSPFVQWQNTYILEVLRRTHYADDHGQTVLKQWSLLQNNPVTQIKEIPWLFILNNWYDWNEDALNLLIHGDSNLQLQMQNAIITNSNYSESIRRSVLIYRCSNNLVTMQDLEHFRRLPSTLTHILIFWVLFRNTLLPKEWAKVVQDIYGANPNYEDTKLAEGYLPGFAGIRNALLSMDIPWHHALAYTESAMKAKKEVHASLRKEFIDASAWDDDTK